MLLINLIKELDKKKKWNGFHKKCEGGRNWRQFWT
jgi:hypothetical protein